MIKANLSEDSVSKILNKEVDILYNNPYGLLKSDYDVDRKIPDGIIDYINEDNKEILHVLQNFRLYLKKGIKYQEGYIEVVNEDFNTFKNAPFINSLVKVLFFHYRQQFIWGKKDNLEPQIADKKIGNDFATELVELEKLKYEIAILIKQSIVKHQPKQTLENINRKVSIFNKETYLWKNDKLVKTHTFNKERFYKTSALKLWEISILKGKCSILTYPLPQTKVSEIQLNNLNCDICFLDTNYFDKDSFNEKLTYDVFSEVAYIDYKNIHSLHFNDIEKNKYKKFIAKNLLSAINKHYNHLSQHAKNIMIGFILSELKLLLSEDDYIDTTNKSSYRNYLNKTVAALLVEKNQKK